MKEVHARTCVLGGGPSALLSVILLRELGFEVLGIAESLFGLLRPMYHEGVRFNLIPIFLRSQSPLYDRVTRTIWGHQEHVTIRYCSVGNGACFPDIKRGSYAEFLAERYPGSQFRLVLAHKHLGPQVFDNPFPEVQRKVIAHYPNGFQVSAKLGFVDGVSPYLAYIEQLSPAVVIAKTINAINLRDKCIVTDSLRISYERLISTVSLVDFLRLAKLPSDFQMFAGGAKFLVLRSDASVRPNQLVYDCDDKSPIYRAFVPRENIISVHVARSHWYDPVETVARRLQQLIDLKEIPIPITSLTSEACYPLGVSDYSLKANLCAQLQQAGVTLHGRFAEWEYQDLDELKWERIGETL
jgi:hypothetical protein